MSYPDETTITLLMIMIENNPCVHKSFYQAESWIKQNCPYINFRKKYLELMANNQSIKRTIYEEDFLRGIYSLLKDICIHEKKMLDDESLKNYIDNIVNQEIR